MADPTPDPVAPDPTQPLSESLGLPAGLAQSQTATPQLAPQGYQGPRPILMDLIQGLIKPKMQAQPGQMARPVSRAATFEDFLGNFVGALGQGFAAAGHGPGAAARGAGAAIGAPLQMQQQQQAFQQQQAQQAAQTQMTQEQAAALPAQRQAQINALTAQPRFDPQSQAYLGTMNDAQYQNYLKGQGAAGVAGQSRLDVAKLGAQTKMSIAELNAATKNGAVKFVKPIQDPNSPGKVMFGAFDAQGNFLRPLDNSIDPSSLAKVNTQMQPDGNGGYVMTQQNTTRPQLPPAGGTPTAGAGPVIGGPARFPQAQSAPATNRIPQPASGGGGVAVAPKVASVGGKPVGPLWSRPDSLGFQPDSSQLGLTQKEKQTEYNKRQDAFKKNADELSKTEGTFNQFGSVLNDINAGKDITGAQSVVALFNAIGISATPLKGAGFRINSNTITEHAEARGLGQSLYQKLLSLKNGDVITPQQVKDYANIANQAREDQYVNLANQVHNSNLNADFVLPQGNGRSIDPSTARIFLRLTGADNQGRGGDPDKARAAAKAKGWKF